MTLLRVNLMQANLFNSPLTLNDRSYLYYINSAGLKPTCLSSAFCLTVTVIQISLLDSVVFYIIFLFSTVKAQLWAYFK